MHLISTLASGVKGAESGTAEIYVRGTSTRAVFYEDFEGSVAISTGVDVLLDLNGGAEVYVNQYVDVVVKNSSGTIIRSFTEGKSAPLTEYRGSSFTGIDYTTGASATGNPVNLQTILNTWFTSAGAADFNVLLEGSSTTIQTAIGTISGFFYNVKSAAYGADGDGISDDTTAVLAAISAAATNGGIVFFPAGTYRITSSISLPANVSLLGIGADISIITMDHASNNLLVLSGGSSGGYQYIKGIGFTASQSYSGTLLYGVTEETFIKIQESSFGGSNTENIIIDINIDHAVIVFDSCRFHPGEIPTTYAGVRISSSAEDDDMMWAYFSGCQFEISSGQTATSVYLLQIAQGNVTGCRFDASKATNSITITCLRFFGTVVSHILRCSATGCFFIGNSTATVYGIDSGVSAIDSSESCNLFADDINAIYGITAFSSQGKTVSIQRQTRESRIYETADNSASIIFPSAGYSNIILERSDATVQSLGATLGPIGSWLTIVIINTNSGAPTGNITFSSSYFYEDIGAFTVAASSLRIFTFRSVNSGSGNAHWGLVGYTGDI